MKDKKSKITGFALVLFGGALWGFTGTCGQWLFTYKQMNAEWLTSVRMLIGGIIMSSLAIVLQRKSVKGLFSKKADIAALCVFAIAGLLTCQYAYFKAISYSNAATGTVLQYLSPALIMLSICVKTLRLPRLKEAIAIILAISGTFLLATHGNINNLAISPSALIFGLFAAVGLALYSLLPGKLIASWGSITVTGFGMLIAGIVFFIATKTWTINQPMDIQTFIFAAIIVIFGTVVPFTTYLKGVSLIGASKASTLSCVEPLSATIFSAIWLKSKFTPIDFIGFAFIMSTVLLLSINKKTDVQKEVENAA